jgi:DNA replication protein DnaC
MKAPAAPALPEELTAVLRRMRLPYVRAAAPEVLATARAQRWDPAEVLRVLLVEEITGRDAATQRMRRKAAGFPTGKTSTAGARRTPPSRRRPSRRCAPWSGWAGPRTWP